MTAPRPDLGPLHDRTGDLLPLTCPYCGKTDLSIDMETRGLAYLTYEAAVGITCDQCNAEWTTGGCPVKAARWIEYPGVFAAPEPQP